MIKLLTKLVCSVMENIKDRKAKKKTELKEDIKYTGNYTAVDPFDRIGINLHYGHPGQNGSPGESGVEKETDLIERWSTSTNTAAEAELISLMNRVRQEGLIRSTPFKIFHDDL